MKFSAVAEDICASLGCEKPAYLNAGQFKEAYKTIDGNGATVALKVFDPAKCNLSRAGREIEAMLQCESPFIGRLYHWGTFIPSNLPPHLYTLEEFFGGGTLTGRMDELRDRVVATLTIGVALLEGVSHLRNHNLVHRDIKPENIMFREEGDAPS